jgi:uncharacterized Zn-binding protein involved in type VI secretion
MAEVARGSSTDTVATGHGCTSTTKTDKCSTNVFANSKGICRKGDAILSHTKPSGNNCVSHSANISGGSNNVFVNNIALSRKGDAADLGSISSGSANVFAN